MQPDGPYRYTHLLGGSPVGKAWAALDQQGRFVTVAVLDATVAATPGWRDAFAGIANSLAQSGTPFTYADFSAAAPWVAYAAEAGRGAETLLQSLGVEYQPVPPGTAPPVSGPPQSVSGPPQSVSGPPHAVSGPPHAVSGPPQSVSGPPHAVSGPPQPVSPSPYAVSPAPASGVPTSGAFGPAAPATGPAVDENGLALAPADPFVASGRRIAPSAPPKRRTGLWLAVAALLGLAAIGGGAGVWAIAASGPQDPPSVDPAATPSAAVPPPLPGLKPWAEVTPRSPEERALATAAPSMVFLEAVLTGYVRDKQNDTLLHPESFTFSRRCSGFVVNHDGHVLTNAQCVQPTPEIMIEHALGALANTLVDEGKLKAGEVSGYVRARTRTTVFTGEDPGSQPDATLYGQLNVAKGNLTASPAIAGTVVRALTLEEGNLALVKLDQGSLPAAELNTSATIAAGTPLRVLGYGTSDTDYRSAEYGVLSKPVEVTEVDIESSVYRVSEDVGASSRGGIVIDAQGKVVGMLDNDLLQRDRPNRVVVPMSRITGLIEAAGVQNGLGEPDQLYRSGLDAYFAGAEAEAAARFGEAAERSPTNLLAQVYHETAVAASAGGEKSSRPGWAVPLLVVAGVALVGGIVALVLFLRRPSAR